MAELSLETVEATDGALDELRRHVKASRVMGMSIMAVRPEVIQIVLDHVDALEKQILKYLEVN